MIALPLPSPPFPFSNPAQASPLACCTYPKSLSDDGNEEEGSEQGILSKLPQSARTSMEGRREDGAPALAATKPEAGSSGAGAVGGQEEEEDQNRKEEGVEQPGDGSTSFPGAAAAAAAGAATAINAAANAAASAPEDAAPASQETIGVNAENKDEKIATESAREVAATGIEAIAAAAMVSVPVVDVERSTAGTAAESAGFGGKEGEDKAGESGSLTESVAGKTGGKARFMSLLMRKGGRKKEDGEVGVSMPASPLSELGRYPQSPSE